MRNLKYINLILLIVFIYPISSKGESLAFHGAYTFETFPGQKACAVYLSIFNNTNKDFLINSTSTQIAEKAEIHDIEIEDEIVKMKKKANLLIRAKEQFFFQPGGTHLMLMGLKKQLIDGTSFSIKFLLENGSVNEVKVMVLNKKMRDNFIE